MLAAYNSRVTTGINIHLNDVFSSYMLVLKDQLATHHGLYPPSQSQGPHLIFVSTQYISPSMRIDVSTVCCKEETKDYSMTPHICLKL